MNICFSVNIFPALRWKRVRERAPQTKRESANRHDHRQRCVRPLRYNFGMFRSMASFLHRAAELAFRSHFVVRGRSMAPSLYDGDLVHAVPAAWSRRRYRRGDIVVVNSPFVGERIVIKRIAGRPGEWVRVDGDGSVRVSGDHSSGMAPAIPAGQPGAVTWVCDDDEYFLLGDNLPESTDSRRYGPVPDGNIIGWVWLRIPTHRLSGGVRMNSAN